MRACSAALEVGVLVPDAGADDVSAMFARVLLELDVESCCRNVYKMDAICKYFGLELKEGRHKRLGIHLKCM